MLIITSVLLRTLATVMLLMSVMILLNGGLLAGIVGIAICSLVHTLARHAEKRWFDGSL